MTQRGSSDSHADVTPKEELLTISHVTQEDKSDWGTRL